MFQISLNLELKVIVDKITVTIFAIVGNFKKQNSFFSLFPDCPADFVLTLLWKMRGDTVADSWRGSHKRRKGERQKERQTETGYEIRDEFCSLYLQKTYAGIKLFIHLLYMERAVYEFMHDVNDDGWKVYPCGNHSDNA